MFTRSVMSLHVICTCKLEWYPLFAKNGDIPVVTLDSCLGNKSDIFYHNNENNQLEK